MNKTLPELVSYYEEIIADATAKLEAAKLLMGTTTKRTKAKPWTMTARQRAIVEYVTQNPGVRVIAVAQHFGRSMSWAHLHARRLTRRGYLEARREVTGTPARAKYYYYPTGK